MKKILLVLLTVFLLSVSIGCSKNSTSSDGNGKTYGGGDQPADNE